LRLKPLRQHHCHLLLLVEEHLLLKRQLLLHLHMQGLLLCELPLVRELLLLLLVRMELLLIEHLLLEHLLLLQPRLL